MTGCRTVLGLCVTNNHQHQWSMTSREKTTCRLEMRCRRYRMDQKLSSSFSRQCIKYWPNFLPRDALVLRLHVVRPSVRLSVCLSVCHVGGSGSHRLEILETNCTTTPKLQSLSQARLKLRTSNLADTFTGSIRTQAHEKFWRKGSVGVSRDWPNFFGYPRIISGTGKAMNFKLGRYIHRVHPNKSPLKFWEKMERGRIQGLPKFFEYPLLSQERTYLRTSNLVGIFTGSMRTKAL